jgi:uncharacterized protein
MVKFRSFRGQVLISVLAGLFIGPLFVGLPKPPDARCDGSSQPTKETVSFLPHGASIIVERADTEAQRSVGLMNRTFLGQKEGMLFSFDRMKQQSFWMYNTRIPLTIIFLDDSMKVIDIQDMLPCAGKDPSSCPVYVSRAPARYAIEVNLGFTRIHHIAIGSKAVIKR